MVGRDEHSCCQASLTLLYTRARGCLAARTVPPLALGWDFQTWDRRTSPSPSYMENVLKFHPGTASHFSPRRVWPKISITICSFLLVFH